MENNLIFDERLNKYYYIKDGKRNYLNCGTRIKAKCYNKEVQGTIQYSMYWHRGYYFLLNDGNKLRLKDITDIEIIPFGTENIEI